MVTNFFNEMFGHEECQFRDKVCNINLKQSLEDMLQGENVNVDNSMYALQEPQNINDHGLCLIIQNQKELIIKPEIFDSIFRAIAKVVTAEPKAQDELPELDENASDDDKARHNAICEEIRSHNAHIEAENKKLEHLQSRICVTVVGDINENNEVAMVRLNNYREEHPAQLGVTTQGSKTKAEKSVEKPGEAKKAEEAHP